MPYLNQLDDHFDKASSQHKALTTVFEDFANFVKDCLQATSTTNQNIIVTPNLSQGLFTTSFAGRTVSFVFTSSLEDVANGCMVGTVTCYIKKDFPKPKQIEFGSFTFNEEGRTNIKKTDSDETICISNDLSTLHMALHFIYESLSK